MFLPTGHPKDTRRIPEGCQKNENRFQGGLLAFPRMGSVSLYPFKINRRKIWLRISATPLRPGLAATCNCAGAGRTNY